jgi:TetR/AcrR family tetracycline transcriptional repressor
LYWHFKNKASLLEEMASAVLAKHHSLPVPEDIAEWTNWLAENARSFRRALLAHRDGALLHAGTSPARVGGDTFRPKVAYLARVGFTEADAAMILLTLSEYTLGCVLESSPARAVMVSKFYQSHRQEVPLSNRWFIPIRILRSNSVCR